MPSARPYGRLSLLFAALITVLALGGAALPATASTDSRHGDGSSPETKPTGNHSGARRVVLIFSR